MDPGAMAMVSKDLCDRRFRRTWKWSSRHLAPESLVVLWFSGISFSVFFVSIAKRSCAVQSLRPWFWRRNSDGEKLWKAKLGCTGRPSKSSKSSKQWPKEFQRVLEATALCMASFTRDSELRHYCLLLVMLLFVTMFALQMHAQIRRV